MAKKTYKHKSSYSFIYSIDFWIELALWLLFGICLSFIFNSAIYINKITGNPNGPLGGTLISLIILISGVIVTPIFGFIIDYIKKSKEVVMLLLFGMSVASWFFFPNLGHDKNNWWSIFLPVFIIFYSYRTIVSGRLSLASETLNIPFGITRSSFYIGYGIGSYLSLYIFEHYMDIYFKAFAIIVTIIFLYISLFTRNPKVKQDKKIHKGELIKTKDILKNKAFLCGVVFLGLLVGIFECQDFMLQRVSSGWSVANGTLYVQYKSYADLIAIPFYFIGFFIIWKIISKANIKFGVIFLIIVALIQLSSTGIFLYVLGSKTPSKYVELIYDGIYGCSQGFFGSALLTIFFEYFALLSDRKNRFKTIAIASGISFGFFTWLFTFSISHLILNPFTNLNIAIIQTCLAFFVILCLLFLFILRNERVLQLKTKTTIINKLK